MTVAFEEHPFWDFSLRVYGTEGVPPACLALQERHGLDVNVLLFCLWAGHSGRGVLGADALGEALAAVAAWNREVVCALRRVRQRLKGGIAPIPAQRSDALRRQILKIEVDCEHAEQLALAAAVARPADGGAKDDRRAADAAANVVSYLDRLGARPDEDDLAHLATILGAAFSDLDRARLAAMLAAAGNRDTR